MTHENNTRRKHHHSDRDRIWTPSGLAEMLVRKVPTVLGDTICDPCLGEGAFYDNFRASCQEHIDWYEIDKGKDFLACDKKYDWCITNIPFSQPKEFIFKMAECSRKGFGILCLANSMTVTRLEQLKRDYGFFPHSITEIYIKSWGFGYKTVFYVFTKEPNESITSIII